MYAYTNCQEFRVYVTNVMNEKIHACSHNCSRGSKLTSQGSGSPIEPGKNNPADSTSHTRRNAITRERGSSPHKGTIAQ